MYPKGQNQIIETEDSEPKIQRRELDCRWNSRAASRTASEQSVEQPVEQSVSSREATEGEHQIRHKGLGPSTTAEFKKLFQELGVMQMACEESIQG